MGALAQKVADDCGIMKREATEILEKILEIIKPIMVSGVDGFETFRFRRVGSN